VDTPYTSTPQETERYAPCSYCKWWKGYILHVHFYSASGGEGYTQHIHTADEERDTPGTSMLLAVERIHMHVHTAGVGGDTTAHPKCM
jgi:hypothetical protein